MTSQALQYLINAAAGAASETNNEVVPNRSTANEHYKAPGRIGDPDMSLSSDPRLHSKLQAWMNQAGMGTNYPGPPLLKSMRSDSTLEEIAALCEQMEENAMSAYDTIPLDLPGDDNRTDVKLRETTIKGDGGREMKVYIYHPRNAGAEKLPCVVYLHGGGMTVIPTFNRVHDRWCKSLAGEGVVVVMPDFSNAWTREKWNPWPAGLNDCAAAVQWTAANRNELGISNTIVHCESGGGNLTLATSLKAKREGWIKDIAGVYCLCPAISNLYGATVEEKLRELPSLAENQGYTLNTWGMAFMGYFYTRQEQDGTNPLAWPYHAAKEELQGLPPHVMVMDELDPLRDEGVSYARKLVEAGVATQTRVNLGMIHAASLLLRQLLPEHHHGVAREVAAFAKAL